jgi:HKD family nuclease
VSLWVQSDLQPDNVRRIAATLVDGLTTDLRVAVAYMTYKGVATLMPEFEGNAAGRWGSISKQAITTFDFGMTEPEALVSLRDNHGFEVRISRPSVLDLPGLRPISAFHPKLYWADSPEEARVMVGSANLTDRALTTNTEAVFLAAIHDGAERDRLAERWRVIEASADPLTDDLLETYRERRRGLRIPRPGAGGHVGPDEQPPTVADVPEQGLTPEVLRTQDPRTWPTLAEAIGSGLNPAHYGQFWVEAGSMSSGGSHNQLELPRLGHRFFGYLFNSYDDEHHVIGMPLLYATGAEWTDRPLTWHGNNRMERLNLPSAAHGGPDYQNTAVLFRRTARGFELAVAPWDGPVSVSWRLASESLERTYRLGSAGARVCGFF